MLFKEFFKDISVSLLSMRSPILIPFCKRFSDSITSNTARAAAHAMGFPPNVPPNPPGGTVSITLALPTTPEIGNPPPILFPTHVKSGKISKCSIANILPVRPMPDWISSAIRTILYLSHKSRKNSMNSRVAILYPPSP